MKKNRPLDLRDESVCAFVYALNMIADDFFKKNASDLVKVEYDVLVDRLDLKGFSFTDVSLRNLFKLTKGDTNTRPQLSTVNAILEILLNYSNSIIQFEKDYNEHIELFYKSNSYVVNNVNPKPTTVDEIIDSFDYDEINLGSKELSLMLKKPAIAKLIRTIEPVISSLVSDKLVRKNKGAVFFQNELTQTRVEIRENRRQRNINAIVGQALSMAQDFEGSITSKTVDEDWIFEFFNIAQEFSQKEFQSLWANLLAGQVLENKNYSRRLIHTIKLMSKEEAYDFNTVANCIWRISYNNGEEENIYILDDDFSLETYSAEKFNIESGDIHKLHSIGLLEPSYFELEKGEEYPISFFGKKHILKSKRKRDFGYCSITFLGEELLGLINAKGNKEYYSKSIEVLSKNSLLRN